MSITILISTICGYIALLFAVAWVSARRVDNRVFFTGARRSPWWVAALGMVAAPMSGVTFVSVPGMVGANGWAYLQMAMGFVVGYQAIAFVLVPLYYRLEVTSIYEYLERRFGFASYKTGAWMFFVSKLLGAALRIYLVCLVLQLIVFEQLGVPFWINAAIVMTLVWLYTFRGGVRSVVWTDALKTACLLLSVGLSIWSIAGELGLDSVGKLTAAIRDSELSRVWFFDDVNDPRWFFKQFFAGFFIVIAMTGLDQDMMQVPLSCRSSRDSQKNFVASGVMQFVVIVLFLSLGTLLSLFASARGISAADDALFPTVATGAGVPMVVGVVFVLGLVSSTFSAAGSALTALTTSFTVDIIGKVAARKWVHAGLAVVMAGVILAFGAINSTSVIDAVYILASYTYGPLLGLFAFGIFAPKRKVRDRWVPLVAVLSPIVCLVLDLNSDAWFDGYRFGYEILMLNAALTFAGMAILIKK